MDLFTVTHIRTGKPAQVTEEQFKQMQKLFPNTFRRANQDEIDANAKPNLDKYSPAARDIIAPGSNEEE